jgi:hypothetical protein
MRLVIKNSIQLCLRTLVFSIYNNRLIITIDNFYRGYFFGHPVERAARKIAKDVNRKSNLNNV